jgi:ribulose-phosphate 3-epimerase
MKVSPSILSADFTRLYEEVEAVTQAGTDYLHIDVMDGHFVPNITIGLPVIESLRRITRLPLDVHLMIEPVEPYIARFVEAGADILTVHVEATRHLDRVLHQIREQKRTCRVGVALNPATPLATLQHVLHLVDMVLLMSVNPGFSGQSFIPETLPKIRALRQMVDDTGREIEIALDGGVTLDNAGIIAAAGVDTCVSGSTLFSAGRPRYGEVIRALHQSCRSSS